MLQRRSPRSITKLIPAGLLLEAKKPKPGNVQGQRVAMVTPRGFPEDLVSTFMLTCCHDARRVTRFAQEARVVGGWNEKEEFSPQLASMSVYMPELEHALPMFHLNPLRWRAFDVVTTLHYITDKKVVVVGYIGPVEQPPLPQTEWEQRIRWDEQGLVWIHGR